MYVLEIALPMADAIFLWRKENTLFSLILRNNVWLGCNYTECKQDRTSSYDNRFVTTLILQGESFMQINILWKEFLKKEIRTLQ